jgi:hypothetical protein
MRARTSAGLQDYPDMAIYCKVDGINIDSRTVNGRVLCRGEGWHRKFDEYRISETMVQKLRFSKPVSIMLSGMSVETAADFPLCLTPQILTEQDTPGLEMTNLATMELKFVRCLKYGSSFDPGSRYRGISERSTTQVNERSKKGSLLTSLTR